MPHSHDIVPSDGDAQLPVYSSEEVSGNISERTDGVFDIDIFLGSVEPVKSLDDFVQFKESMNVFFRKIFASKLEGKSETFFLAFDQSNVSKYQETSPSEGEETRRNLRYILKDKNALYSQILVKALRTGLLDDLVTPETKEDFIRVVDSNILAFFDEVFIHWFDCMSKGENPLSPSEFPVYGGMKGGQRVGYNEFSSISIDVSQFQHIHNSNLREYLQRISGFIQDGNYTYADWVGAELYESKIWQDQSSEIGFVAPMEDYVFPGVFIEPEIILFLKDTRNPVRYSDFYNLSERFFNERYGMDHMTCTNVETVLEGGDASYSGFIGKAFPNDESLSKKEGNNIILRTSPMRKVVLNSREIMHRLFPGKAIDFDVLFLELLREVTYHEFGHSLFVKGHPTSQLEEAKATLFYYLGVYDAHKQSPYSQEDKEKVVLFTIMDSIRNIERMTQPEFKKYLILTKSILIPLFESGLVKIGDGGLELDMRDESFDIFLNNLCSLLFDIQKLYTLDNKEIEERERVLLENIDKNSERYISYIANRIKG